MHYLNIVAISSKLFKRGWQCVAVKYISWMHLTGLTKAPIIQFFFFFFFCIHLFTDDSLVGAEFFIYTSSIHFLLVSFDLKTNIKLQIQEFYGYMIAPVPRLLLCCIISEEITSVE